jgi:uncharacterized membrane protein
VTTWKFLHVACMLGAFSIGVGGGTVAHHVVTTGDVAAIRRVLPTWDRIGNLVGIPLFVLGLGFGFVTGITGGFDLTAPWLLISYGLVVGILVHGFAVYDPQLQRLKAAAAASPVEQPSPELAAIISSRRTRITFRIEVGLWLAVIVTMVTKPLS